MIHFFGNTLALSPSIEQQQQQQQLLGILIKDHSFPFGTLHHWQIIRRHVAEYIEQRDEMPSGYAGLNQFYI